ncbi:MAG: hypothetical protein LQ346_006946 [Caloplaca aetnensis]|nr:MAG: hypothetical protein LQ346_006946 [Caloplaca aetnensis]
MADSLGQILHVREIPPESIFYGNPQAHNPTLPAQCGLGVYVVIVQITIRREEYRPPKWDQLLGVAGIYPLLGAANEAAEAFVQRCVIRRGASPNVEGLPGITTARFWKRLTFGPAETVVVMVSESFLGSQAR